MKHLGGCFRPYVLPYRCGVSLSAASRTFTTWLTVMDIKLSPIIRWPEREELWHTMPLCFQFSFGKKTTIIIDCFEIFIERPSNLLGRAQTFSNYKHHNTVKVLIAITPQGSIFLISVVYWTTWSQGTLLWQTEGSPFRKVLHSTRHS